MSDQNSIFIENEYLRDINPLECGEHICSDNYTIGPKYRECYLIHYVVSGKGTYITPNHSYNVKEGQIFVIFPYEMTTYKADDTDPWHYCWVAFDANVNLTSMLSSYVLDMPECAHIFEAITSSGKIDTGREFYLCGKIFELLSLLSGKGTPCKDNTTGYVQHALNHVHLNYRSKLSVEELAVSLNIDRAYFSRIFRRQTGKTPRQYIVEYRLRKAAELIVYQNLLSSDAAREVGYTDIFHFSKMFKQHFGVPPSMYRANNPYLIHSPAKM
jgi:AraC-like DNA-binding protein